MHCPEGSITENLAPYLLVPGSSRPQENMEGLLQDPWQGKGRPGQVLWLQLSLTLCMFEHLPFDSVFILGSLYKTESLTQYLFNYSDLLSPVQLLLAFCSHP